MLAPRFASRIRVRFGSARGMTKTAYIVPGMYAGRCVIAELRKACCHVSMTVTVRARPWQSDSCLHACWGIAAQSKVAEHVVLIFV